MTSTAAQTLDNIEFLSVLDPEQRRSLAQRCRWRRYGAHEQIVDRDTDSTDFFMVVTGRVRVVIYSASGREVHLDEIEAGGYFGELAAIDSENRSASVVALEPTTTAALTGKQFRELYATNPDLAHGVVLRLVHIIRHANERIYGLSTQAVGNRVQAELARLGRLVGMDERGKSVLSPPPVLSDLALRVSSTRETVSRVVNDMVRNGILQRSGNALVIPDLARLEAMAEEGNE